MGFFHPSRFSELTLSNCGLSGPLPLNFSLYQGTKTSGLGKIDFSRNNLQGDFPRFGFTTPVQPLQYLDISYNNFTTLKIEGNLSLSTVKASNNFLMEIFDDDSFRSISTLTYFDVSGNPTLKEAPLKWIDYEEGENYKLKGPLYHFDVRGCNLTQPFPTLLDLPPKLRHLDISENYWCSPVPGFVSTSSNYYLSFFSFHTTGLYGAFPGNWDLVEVSELDFSNSKAWFSWTNVEVSQKMRLSLRALRIANTPEMLHFAMEELYRLIYALTELDVRWLSPPNDACFPPGPTSLPSTFIMYLSTCDLTPSVSNCECAGEWAQCLPESVDLCGLPPPMPAHIIMEINNVCSVPQLAPSSPNSAPSNPNAAPTHPRPKDCPPPRPSPEFTCNTDSGNWVSNGSTSIPGYPVVIPRTTVQVYGNLTFPDSSVVFSGTGASVVVDGCEKIFFGTGSGSGSKTPQILIELTQADIDAINKAGGKIDKTILKSLTGNQCAGSTDLSTVKITSKSPKKGCKKYRVTNNKSSKGSLNVLFSSDSSNCNIIIIACSVVGGVIILTALVLIIYFAVKSSHKARSREMIRN